MADWTLYHSTRSPFVRKVMIAAIETGLDHRIAIRGVLTNPMTPAPELMGQSPAGQIPLLVIEGGEALVDSAAIMDFLSEAAPGHGLLPPAGPDRRDALRRQAVADAGMDKALRWLDETYRNPCEDGAARVRGYCAALGAIADWCQARAGEWPGSRFDVGDIAVACLLAYLDFRFAEVNWREGRPVLAGWFDRIAQRPSVAATSFHTQPVD